MSLEEVLKAVSSMNEKFNALREDVDQLKDNRKARSRSPRGKSPATSRGSSRAQKLSHADACTRDWADRDLDEPMDYSAQLHFSDEDDTGIDGEQLVDVSEETHKTRARGACLTRQGSEFGATSSFLRSQPPEHPGLTSL